MSRNCHSIKISLNNKKCSLHLERTENSCVMLKGITVKTSPNWSKRPHGIKCWSKSPQNYFLLYILCNFRHDLGCLNEIKCFCQDSILLFQLISKIALRMLFSINPSIHNPSNITVLNLFIHKHFMICLW